MTSHLTPDIDTYDLGLTLKVAFKPVDGRLCQKAGTSGVGVELHDGRLSLFQDGSQVGE
jgi:hypothetical protein